MKRRLISIFILALPMLVQTMFAQDKKPTNLRELLLAELRSTHTNAEWFVPANVAVKGLTAEQASWTDGKGNHSVGQLAYHLVFWNKQNLARLKGEKPDAFNGKNDETFDKFDSKRWSDTVRQLDEVLTEMEHWVETVDEAKLKESAQTLTHISTHNAYHIGQIIYVRKEQGSWDPKNGVN
ncbi:MAG TPA: DinB family protein [Candidatus Angelobacter sp.]|nr:DinB family protein [Candidatus Angelobacter sp.]